MIRWPAACSTSLVLCLVTVFGAGPQEGFEKSPQVRYFEGKAIDLPLDRARLAVFIAGDVDGSQTRTSLSKLGFAASDVTPYVVDGWSYVATPREADSRDKVESLALNIARAGAVDFVSPVFFDEYDRPMHATPDVLVRFHPQVGRAAALQALGAVAPQIAPEIDWGGMANAYRLRGVSRDGLRVLAVANALAARNDVKWAEVDWMMTGELLGGFPNDPSFPNCWAHENTGQVIGCGQCLTWNAPAGVVDMDMDTPEAWAITTGDTLIVVAIFDTGIIQNHNDINQITPGYDFVNPGGDGGQWTNCDTHGTAVAGAVSAFINNGIGGVGVAPGCNSISMKMGNQGPDGQGGCNGNFGGFQASNVVDALEICENIGVRITNHSYSVGSNAAMTDKLADSKLAGIVHFGSAGNGGADNIGDPTILYPASTPAVNAVAGLDPDGALTGFSNFGNDLFISAPGVGVCGTGACFCGTSASAPTAAGVAALVLSIDPSLTPVQVENILAQSAMDLGVNGYDTTFGWGFINAHQAVLDAIGCRANGSCFAAHGSPGCSNSDCCAQVCVSDPFCCNVEWDGLCVDEAVSICLGCPGDGPCDQPHGGIGCSDPVCCEQVCLADSFCCDDEFGWDQVCVALAIDLCDLNPSNDDCSDAILIDDGFTPFTVANASNDGISHGGCGWDASFIKDVWFKYTAECTGFVSVSTCDLAPFNTWLAVYDLSACPPNAIALLGCNNDSPGCASGSSLIENIFLTQGEQILIRVGALNTVNDNGGLFVACQPFFDNCEDAFFLGSFTGNINYNTHNATTDGPGHVACSGGGNVQIFNDVWFDWVAPCSGTVTLQTCGLADFDTKIAIYQDCSCNELGPNLLGCNDNAPNCANQGSRLNVPVVEDQCYKIRVGGAGAAEGSGQLNITCNAAPPNDDCEDASLTFLGIPTPFTTENSFTDGVHHAACGSQIVHDVWFRRTATCTGFMTVSTCGTADFDTMIAVYDDCECPATDAELIGCNNDAPNCAGNGSRVTVPVYEGRCYLVRIGAPPLPVLTEGGSQGETGSGSVTFSCFETCEGDANVNGVVDVDDLLMVINNWGNCDADETCLGDLTGNGVVDVDDLLEVINNWGPCFPT